MIIFINSSQLRFLKKILNHKKITEKDLDKIQKFDIEHLVESDILSKNHKLTKKGRELLKEYIERRE